MSMCLYNANKQERERERERVRERSFSLSRVKMFKMRYTRYEGLEMMMMMMMICIYIYIDTRYIHMVWFAMGAGSETDGRRLIGCMAVTTNNFTGSSMKPKCTSRCRHNGYNSKTEREREQERKREREREYVNEL